VVARVTLRPEVEFRKLTAPSGSFDRVRPARLSGLLTWSIQRRDKSPGWLRRGRVNGRAGGNFGQARDSQRRAWPRKSRLVAGHEAAPVWRVSAQPSGLGQRLPRHSGDTLRLVHERGSLPKNHASLIAWSTRSDAHHPRRCSAPRSTLRRFHRSSVPMRTSASLAVRRRGATAKRARVVGLHAQIGNPPPESVRGGCLPAAGAGTEAARRRSSASPCRRQRG
jgi:hypothetical protein